MAPTMQQGIAAVRAALAECQQSAEAPRQELKAWMDRMWAEPNALRRQEMANHAVPLQFEHRLATMDIPGLQRALQILERLT